MSTETTNATFTVTIYATKGGKKVKIETAAKTWAQLKPEVRNAGFDVDKMHATEGIKKTGLVIDAAEIPQQNFYLFLTPKETKSGADRSTASSMKYKDLKAAIKEDVEAFGDAAKSHYGNYTTATTAKLQEMFGSFVEPVGAGAVKEKAAPKKKADKNVADVVESVKEAKQIPVTNADRAVTVRGKLEAISANTDNEDLKDRISDFLEEFVGIEAEIAADTKEKDPTEFVGDNSNVVASAPVAETPAAPAEPVESEEDRIAREEAEEQARLDKEENDELAKMTNDFGLGKIK
jgi:hypothetical protein